MIVIKYVLYCIIYTVSLCVPNTVEIALKFLNYLILGKDAHKIETKNLINTERPVAVQLLLKNEGGTVSVLDWFLKKCKFFVFVSQVKLVINALRARSIDRIQE